ncbi:haloacid dehalogenase type II [Bradyrhizobium sp. WYCCWR 13022]|uniref:haloacid dehalogenase type II n=1 Tax=unclassified Bradyrhizobium TaxID=2631580 RepID=UPI00263BACE7|nr:haloacid dehalogenase type II [Bradyrhizobium sp. WYCCWR 13022]MDN4985590.1 haloacid dehalogenase type II [Bradyrhizobium sp. WYCCWR 13022]
MSDLPLIVFDVNETLLDIRTVEPVFKRVFQDKVDVRHWFANLVLYSLALTAARSYVPFTDIGAAAFKMLADTQGVRLERADSDELRQKFSTMPPYPEVPGALESLRNAGFRLFTLTNNLAEVQAHQLERGGIAGFFEGLFSVDSVKLFKPWPQTYDHVARELAVQPSQLCMVACHAWDTLGAVAAGWSAAFVRRADNELMGVGPQPQIIGSDLTDVAQQLIARYAARR